MTLLTRTISALLMCALGYVGYVLYERQLAWTIEQKASVNARAWLEFFSETVPDFTTLLETGEPTEEQIEALRASKEALDVFRFKLFNSDGTLTFLSDSLDGVAIGGTDLFQHNAAASEALRTGEIWVSLEDGTQEPTRPDSYAEIYLPVILGQTPAGIVEVYVDMSASRVVAEAAFARFATLLGGVGLLALLIPTLHWAAAWRETSRKNARLEDTAAELQRTAQRQSRLAEEVGLIGELNEWLQSSRSQTELFDMVAAFLTRLLPHSSGEVYIYANSRDVLEGRVGWQGAAPKPQIHPEDCWGLRRGRTYAYGERGVGFECNHVDHSGDHSYFCFPLLAHGETIGLLHVRQSADADQETLSDVRRVGQICAEQISMAIANVQMRDELKDQSIRDSLTGLFNRRHLANSLRRALALAERRSKSVALLSIDVDHFKSFNDVYGHDAGDLVLRQVGELLEMAVDGDELACRLGGEEFIVVLPDSDMADALHRAETIRENIQGVAVKYGEKTLPSVTVSIGVALSPQDGRSPQDLMSSADQALYAAKAEGRNRTVVTNLVGYDGAPTREAGFSSYRPVGLDPDPAHRTMGSGKAAPPRAEPKPAEADGETDPAVPAAPPMVPTAAE